MSDSVIYIPYRSFCDGDGNSWIHPYSDSFYIDKDTAIEALKQKVLREHEKYSNVTLVECNTLISNDIESFKSVYAFLVKYTVQWLGIPSNTETQPYFVREYKMAT